MLLVAILITAVFTLVVFSGLLVLRIKKLRKKKAYQAFMKKMGYDKIGYA